MGANPIITLVDTTSDWGQNRRIPFAESTMRHTLLPTALAVVVLAACATSPQKTATAAKPYRSPKEILDAAPESDWRTPDPSNLLYMQIATPDGKPGRVIIELAPQFAPNHAANIRTLAHEHFWDGTSIYRVQDNFVVQFGDADSDDAAKAKSLGGAKTHLSAEFHRSAAGLAFDKLPDVDGWAKETGFSGGFPAARDPQKGTAWLAHCYGMVGAGRNEADDSSTGSELYVVIGQSPRMLDDNITVVGRVLQGIELLSPIKRGPAPMGFYENASERTPITSIALASDLPESQRANLRVLRTDTQTFRDMVEARRNRVDSFYKRPAGHIDLCNINVPVREVPAK